MKNKMLSFFATRNIENEFLDFKSFYINGQLKEVYEDLYVAYKKKDKVTLQRSLSESMFEYCSSLLRANKPNPFYRNITKMGLIQARMFSQSDFLLPEDQWAQLTVKFEFDPDTNEGNPEQYNVFERNHADKLSYLEWKLSYIINEGDFDFMHEKIKAPEKKADNHES